MRLGIAGCMMQTILKTHRTARSSFRLILQSGYSLFPVSMVVLVFHVGHILLLQKADKFMLSNIKLLLRIDIGIGKYTVGRIPLRNIHSTMAAEQGAQQACNNTECSLAETPSGKDIFKNLYCSSGCIFILFIFTINT